MRSFSLAWSGSPRRLALLVALLTLLVLLYPWYRITQVYHDSLLLQRRAQLSVEVSVFSSSLSNELNQRLVLMQVLKAYVEAQITKNTRGEAVGHDEFAALAATLVASVRKAQGEGVEYIILAPDGLQTYIYPLEGNENLLGLDLLNDPRPSEQPSTTRAVIGRQMVVSRLQELRPGVNGVVLKQAIFKPQGERLWGLILMAQEIKPLLAGAGIAERMLSSQADVAVRDSFGYMLYGSPATFDQNPVTHQIALTEGQWEVAAVPYRGWESTNQEALRSETVLQLGLLAVVLLCTLLAYLLTNRQARLALAVEQRTRQLSEELVERQRAEQALYHSIQAEREREQIYGKLFEASLDAIFLEAIDGRVLDCNQAALDMFGYTRQEMLNLRTFDLVPEEVAANLPQLAEQLLQQDGVLLEAYNKDKAGRVFPVEVSLRPVRIGDEARVVVYVRDITGRKQDEARLRQNEERLRHLIQNMPVMMAAFDDHTHILAWNGECERVTGFSAPEMLSNTRALWLLFPQNEDRLQAVRRWEASQPDYRGQEQVITCKDGSQRTIAWSNISKQFPVEGWVSWGIGVDITDRKEREQQLSQRNRELMLLNRTIAAATSTLQLERVLEIILAELARELGVSQGAIAILDEDGRQLKVVADHQNGERPGLVGVTVTLEDTESWQELTRSRYLLIQDALTDFRMAPVRQYLQGREAGSLLLLPLRECRAAYEVSIIGPATVRQRTIGVVALDMAGRDAGASQEEIDLAANVAAAAAQAIENARLFESLQQSHRDLARAYDTTLEGWARAMELRDRETEGHTRRVANLTVELGQALGMRADELVQIRRGALLHDIGKLAIPDGILFKPGPLDEAEWQIMRKHTSYALELLAPIPHLRAALDIPYHHHEHWDGSGYPLGLRGEQIPLAARIFTLIDVWDALRSDRPYRQAWPEEEVRAYIRNQSGTLFDPRVVEAFFKLSVLG